MADEYSPLADYLEHGRLRNALMGDEAMWWRSPPPRRNYLSPYALDDPHAGVPLTPQDFAFPTYGMIGQGLGLGTDPLPPPGLKGGHYRDVMNATMPWWLAPLMMAGGLVGSRRRPAAAPHQAEAMPPAVAPPVAAAGPSFADRARSFGAAADSAPFDLGGGLVLTRERGNGAVPGIVYRVTDNGEVVADMRIAPPRQVSPTLSEMLRMRHDPAVAEGLPFAGTIERISVEPTHQRRGIATRMLDAAEQDLARVQAGLHPGETNYSPDFLRLYASRDPFALWDGLRRQGHGPYSDQMLRFATTMRERGTPIDVGLEPPPYRPRLVAPPPNTVDPPLWLSDYAPRSPPRRR